MIKKEDIAVFIFARKNSKGLKNKNLKKINNKSLVEYSIKLAKKLQIKNIFISSDNKKLNEVAEKNNIGFILRPNKLAKDKSREWDAWQHAILSVMKKKIKFKYFLSLPPTGPTRSLKDVKKTIQKMVKYNCDIVINVKETNANPWFNLVSLKKNFKCNLVNKTKKRIFNRQDAPKVYQIITSAYFAKKEFILKKRNIFDGKVFANLVPNSRSVDIDDIYDFKYAKFLLENK